MDLRQLRYFVAIVEHGSMTRAADALHVAQPALSQQINNLETELGGRLFDRSSQGMTATPSGEVMFRRARSILREVDEMRSVIGREIATPSGHVSIGLAGSTAKVVAVPLLKALKAHPGIVIELVERPSAELTSLTARGAVDMVIAADAQPNRAMTVTPLFRERLYAVLPGHGRTRENPRATISLAEFAGQRLLLASRPNTIRNRLETALLDANLSYQLAGEVSATDLAVRLVAAGIGATVLPWSGVAAEASRGLVSIRSFRDIDLSRELSLCRPRDMQPSPAVELVQSVLLSSLRSVAASPSWRGVTPVRRG